MRGRQSACCFTGHRPGKLPWRYDEEDLRCVSLKARIFDAVEAAYQEIVAAEPERFVRVDAAQAPEKVAEDIWRQVLDRLTEAEA